MQDSSQTLPGNKPASSIIENTLENMMVLRKTLSSILNLLHSKRDTAIEESLQLVRLFFSADRVALYGFHENRQEAFFIQESLCETIPPFALSAYQQMSIVSQPWLLGAMSRGKHLAISDKDEIPQGGETEKQFMAMNGILSFLAAPTIREETVNGCLIMEFMHEKRHSNSMDVENLHMFADLISLAVKKEQDKKLLSESALLLLRSESMFRIIFEYLSWGVEVYDEKGDLIDINPADLEIFGVTKEQALGLNLFKNPNLPDYLKEKVKSGEEADMEINYNFDTIAQTGYYNSEFKHSFRHIKGKCVPLKDCNQQVFGYLFLVNDDTENYLKNEAIQLNLAKLETAVDTGKSFLWEYDTQTRQISVDLNGIDQKDDNDEVILFYRKAVLDPMLLFTSIHPEDYNEAYNQKHLALMNGELEHYKLSFRRILDGKVFWFSSNVRSYKQDENGKPLKIVCYTTDITKEKEKELELFKAKEADKLKTAFMANMSHEIRTPLNAIVGFSNILVEMNSNPDAESFRETINKNNELLLQLVDDILDFSQIELGKLDYLIANVNIKEVCQEVLDIYQPMLHSGVEIVFDPALPAYILHTDRKRIRQVISQFIGNAFKFTKEGHITLTYDQTDDGSFLLRVIDTGIGISERDKDAIFESFYKINTFNQGAGLGLPIAKSIIETMGGAIGVESEEGKGSTFWFSLPKGRVHIVSPSLEVVSQSYS